MAFATLNGLVVLRGTIGMPRIGAWQADLAVDAPDAVDGACSLEIDGGLTLVGTAYRSGVWLETARLRVVGGAGGLGRTARPQHYRRTSLRVVLGDLLKTAGERLSATASPATLGLAFPGWTTIAVPVGRMIAALLEDGRLTAGTAWRVLADGTLWVGPEAWPGSTMVNVIDYQELDQSPEDGRLELGVEAPWLLPGTLLGGRRVSRVEHRLDGEAARTTAWLE